jgi:hypothetical protein
LAKGDIPQEVFGQWARSQLDQSSSLIDLVAAYMACRDYDPDDRAVHHFSLVPADVIRFAETHTIRRTREGSTGIWHLTVQPVAYPPDDTEDGAQ